ncbi:penicillin acylase family protein [Meiothermus sp. QL-1]|uniref:penicillin acylase family protein n=1 Tax=Meiothermus sp. QL-1 TaxID=2058095 RepID=UPI000E0C8D2C|nr:penicillin acylase family protein [Meiothermus sp. QL-1]RDI95100.1 penicillin acylase family protein [Meiothermus sp. QL-1]
MRGLRFLGWLALGLVGLALLGGVGGYLWLRGATLPQHSGRLALRGLLAPVELYRTPEGVLHIKAETDPDVFFALGVAHAQDRLWQMEFQRRIGAGRLSEVLGRSTLDQDRFLRTWGFYRAAEEAYKNLSPEGKAVVDAYVAGVNAYLATNPPLPLEFRLLGFRPEPWKPADVLVWAKMMSYDLSGNWRSELMRLQWAARGISPERMAELKPPYPEDAPTVLQSEDLRQPPPPRPDQDAARRLLSLADQLPRAFQRPGALWASNNWVIGPARSASGKPLLANDPHLGLGAPSIWYLVHMEAPNYKAIGSSFPGLPAVVIGRNERIGWGVTTVGADVQDLYILEEAPGGYRYQGRIEPWRIRTEVIRVKGEADVVLRVRESRYGPVINDVVDSPGARPLALRWTSLDPTDRTLEAFLGIARAKNWEEFKAALAPYNAPSQNFVYADVDGNIGYIAPGRFPIRRPGHTGLVPVPGDGNWDWQGYLPPSAWPQVLNPKEGFIATANNKVTPPDYPHTLSLEWEEPYRALRIRELILGKEKLTLEDMVAMQQDLQSLIYREFRPALEALTPLSENARRWRERLLAWDGVMRAEQAEPTVFQAWYTELSRLPAREVGQAFWDEPRYLLKALRQGDPACQTQDTQTCLEYAALALDKALDRLGGNPPRWGEVHQATFPHALLTHIPLLRRFSDRAIAHGGDHYTLNRASYDPETFRMTQGSSYRQILDFADLERSLFIHPMGQSGALLSPQYGNLLKRWASGGYLPMRMNENRLATRLVLEPAP